LGCGAAGESDTGEVSGEVAAEKKIAGAKSYVGVLRISLSDVLRMTRLTTKLNEAGAGLVFLFLQFKESKDRKRTGLKSGRYKFKKRPVETKLFLSGVG